jgi:alpha-1,2-mannosyltransferase
MDGKSQRWLALASALWLLPLVIISIVAVLKPADHTVTPVYHEAVDAWRQQLPLYNHKFYYCPQFTFLFAPFHWLPLALGDALWRLVGTVAFAGGLLVFCRSFAGARAERAFLIAALLAMPLSLQAMQFGQANLHLAAVLLLAGWCLSTQRWWAATVLLWLTVVIKPLGLAALGLAWAAYPQLWWRLALGLPVFLLAPYAFGPASYVSQQYLACVDNLRQSTGVTENRFADLNGLLRACGASLGGAASFLLRAISGALVMLLCWRISRRQAEPLRALVWLSAAAVYLMLFNPMTEANSYVVLAPALALLGGWHFIHHARGVGWVLAAMLLTMGLLPEPLRPLFGNDFALAWYPAMALVFVAILIWTACTTRPSTPATA